MTWKIVDTGFVNFRDEDVTYPRSFPTLLSAVRHIEGDEFASYLNGLAKLFRHDLDVGAIVPILLYNDDIYINMFFQYTFNGNLKLYLRRPPSRRISTMGTDVYAVVYTSNHNYNRHKKFSYIHLATKSPRSLPTLSGSHGASITVVDGDGKAVRRDYAKFMAMRIPASEKSKNLHIANHVGGAEANHFTNRASLVCALHGACLLYPWIPAMDGCRGMINAQVAKVVGGLFKVDEPVHNIKLRDLLRNPKFFELFTENHTPYAIEPTTENIQWVCDNGAKWYLYENKIVIVDQRLATLHKVGYS